jgi:pyruvate,water dikinase
MLPQHVAARLEAVDGCGTHQAKQRQAKDEQDDAVKWMIRSVIGLAHKAGAKVGLCGQAPSDHPEFAEFLVQCGIDPMSVSPDSFIAVKQRVAATESTPV